MHALVNAAGCQKGGCRRWSSAGERVVYNMNRGAGEGRVKKLDAFSVCRVQTSRAIWRGSTTRLAQHDRGRVQRSIARVQSSTKQCSEVEAWRCSVLQDKNTTPRATDQPKGSITANRLSINNQALRTLWAYNWLVKASHRSHNALSWHPCRHPLRSDLRLLRLQGQVSWASRSLLKYSNLFDQDCIVVHRRNARATRAEWAIILRRCMLCNHSMRKVLTKGCRDGFPSHGFLRRVTPNADALTACQIRGLPLGGNQDEAIVKPDGNGSAIMLLLNAHLAARQEIARKAFAHGNSDAPLRSTALRHTVTMVVKLLSHRPCIMST